MGCDLLKKIIVAFLVVILAGIFVPCALAVTGTNHDGQHHQTDAHDDQHGMKPSMEGHEKMDHAPKEHQKTDHDEMDHTGMDHSAADHGEIDHSNMDHSRMDHVQEDHTEMDHSRMDHGKMVMAAKKEDPDLAQQVKIEERLGSFADLETVFVDETGRDIMLKSLFDKPVVLLPVYFACPDVCSFLQTNLASVLNRVNQTPGTDFNVVTLSFSDDEDHTYAYTSKRNFANLITRQFPMENWTYLTGDRENILKLTQSLGYFFLKKKPHLYIHPSALIVLAEDGKIIRYLYGPNFLPFDLGLALNEADKGEPGISVKRGVLSFCFDYDPENKTYVFKMFRITGTAVLLFLAGFVGFLIYPSKKRKGK